MVNCRDKLAVRIENLHSVVERVADQNISTAIKREAVRRNELSDFRTFASNGAQERAIGIETYHNTPKGVCTCEIWEGDCGADWLFFLRMGGTKSSQ